MKERIMKIYDKYITRNPNLKNKMVLLFIEGLGSYKGNATKDTKLHPKGRMGAVFAIITKDEELFYTSYASTLPDIPMGIGKYNTGTPTPTLCIGIYKAYSKLHLNKYPAMEVGLGNEKVPVIRKTGESSSMAINIHSRPTNDYKNTACSTGCLTVLNTQFPRMLEVLGVTKNNKFGGEGRFIGELIIDRSLISEQLKKLYKNIYGSYYNKVFNTD